MSQLSPLNQPRDEELTRARGTGSLEKVRKKLWRSIRAAEEILYDQGAPPKQVLRAAHCISQVANTYARITEKQELEERVERLEQRHKKQNEVSRQWA